MLEKELASGERQDTLFLGIYFGMTNRDFFTHCWELNKQQIIKQGNGNISVEYQVKEMKYRALMNFYPRFRLVAMEQGIMGRQPSLGRKEVVGILAWHRIYQNGAPFERITLCKSGW